MTSSFASEAQIDFVADLLKKKAWNDDASVGAKFVTRAAAINIAINWAKESPSPEVTDVATAELVGQRVNQILAHVIAGGVEAGLEYAWAPFTGKSASNMISWLKGLPKKAEAATPAAAPAAPAERVEIEDGMYRFENRFYKVQHAVHGSGKQYAKLAVIESVPSHLGAAHDTWTVRFEYARGVVSQLRPEHKLTYEQAKEFGALYGTCCRCGKTLTDELSIALGIGPVCGGREFGGEFKAILKAAKLELKQQG